jgi:hypothetical protein
MKKTNILTGRDGSASGAPPLCRASVVIAVGWPVDAFLSLNLPAVQLIVSLLSPKYSLVSKKK